MHSIPENFLNIKPYSDFKEIGERKLSLEELSTLVELLDISLKSISMSEVKTVVENNKGYFLFVLKGNEIGEEFDFYQFINEHSCIDQVINCVNAKYICSKKYSIGEIPDELLAVSQEVGNQSETQEEGTGYLSQEDLLKTISGEVSVSIINNRTGSTKAISSKPFSIGRSKKDADLIIENSNLTRVHCFLYEKGGSLFIVDNKSLNGTFVNGVKCTPNQEHEIHSGDIIYLADEKFTVE